MKIKYYIVFLIIICYNALGICQKTDASNIDISVGNDTLKIFKQTNNLLADTIPNQVNNGIGTDTTVAKGLDYKLAKDAIEDEVKYNAKDRKWFDLANKKVHLFGGATIEYQKIKLTANYAVIDFANNIIQGFDQVDSLKIKGPKPSFSDDQNTFTYNELKYNFKSKKGIVQHAISQQGEFNLVGSTTKFIGGAIDSLGTKEDDRVYNEDAIITTCTHDPPHFGIRTGKLKFVPNKLAVMSVANLEIAKIPTPLFLPFGFFPLAKGKSSGLIFPASYEYNAQLGLGFREIGYYWPISNNVDMKLTGDIYTRGSWGVRVNTRYKKRYGYEGNIAFGYSKNVIESTKDATKSPAISYIININHRQDSKAHPYRRLNGSVNIQSNRYDQRVYENVRAALTNQYTSTFSFQHDMPGTPFRFAADFRHSQNTTTRIVDLTLPNITLNMNTIYPFKRKNSTKEVWSDNIAVSYNSQFRNFVKTTDTTLFKAETLKNFQTGLQQRASVSTNFKVLKYLNLSPNISYEETWLLKKYQLTFNPDSVIIDKVTGDTLGFKAPTESFVNGFNSFRNFNSSITLNTQIFGTLKGGKGFFRGLRHVMKPNLSFGYSPENQSKYQALVDTDTREAYNKRQTYNILSNGAFGTLSGNQQQLALGYGITNIIEAKFYSKKDTIEKKVRIFDNLSINGNYNFAADSFQWSPIAVSGNTTFFKGLSNFNFRASYSPYVYDNNGKITKKTVWDNGKILPEFRNMTGGLFTSLSFSAVRQFLTGKKKDNNQKKSDDTKDNDTTPKPIGDISLADWFENFNLTHSINYTYAVNKTDTFYISNHSISLNGSIPLTKNWNLTIGNISYDFLNKAFPYPYLGFSRDLHCWTMNFNWSPTNNVYNFYVGVKSSALNFLKYDYGQRNANTLFSGQR